MPPNLISQHRSIHRRLMNEAQELRAQLAQRGVVLWSLLKKHGPQVLTADEMGGMVAGCTIVCTPNQEAQSVTFTAQESEDRSNDEAKP